ncbi:MAG: hypothetical protein ACQKBW_06405, partial [Puniceicoccales bacterium]
KGDHGREIEAGAVPGAYDELTVWNRVLSEEEIQTLATQPEKAAQALHTLKRDWRWERWPAKAQLVYRHFTDSIIAPGEAFSFDLEVRNDTQQDTTASVSARLLDFHDQEVATWGPEQVDLPAHDTFSTPLSFTAERTGFYRVEVATRVGERTVTRDITTFGCLQPGVPPRHDFFGGHINADAGMAEVGRQLGFAGTRVHNMSQFTWWKNIEPEPGAWTVDKRRYQRYLDLGYRHYGQWFATPYWAAQTDGEPLPRKTTGYPKGWVPGNQDALARYVERAIRAFPEIHEWEIWNEPYVPRFWSGTPEQYVSLARVVYASAKATDPGITVFAQFAPRGEWARTALRAGIMEACDGVAWHDYRSADTQPQEIRETIDHLRQMLAEDGGVEDVNSIPLIMSEGGISGGSVLRGVQYEFPEAPEITDTAPGRRAAIGHVQASVVRLSMGVMRQYYYAHVPLNAASLPRVSGRVSTMELTNTPRPLAIAQAILVRMLDGGTFEREIVLNGGDLRLYLFKRSDGKTLIIAWTENETSASLQTPGTAHDLMGNPLPQQPGSAITVTGNPIYILCSESPAEIAEAL